MQAKHFRATPKTHDLATQGQEFAIKSSAKK